MSSFNRRLHPDFCFELDEIKRKLKLNLSDSQASKIIAEQLKAMNAIYDVKGKKRKCVNIETKLRL